MTTTTKWTPLARDLWPHVPTEDEIAEDARKKVGLGFKGSDARGRSVLLSVHEGTGQTLAHVFAPGGRRLAVYAASMAEQANALLSMHDLHRAFFTT